MSTPEQAARELAQLGRQLKEAPKELRKELLAEIRKEGKPAVEDVKRQTDDHLPRRGGLAERVARQSYGVRTRLAGRSAGVRIQGTGRTVRALRSIDAGSLRHPVFGNRDVWVSQSVRPGFFTEPLENDAPRFRRAIEKAIARTSNEVTRGI